jgi:filamentous hemagglutinin family protein
MEPLMLRSRPILVALLSSCALASPALAQIDPTRSFQGIPTVSQGGVTINISPTQDRFLVDSTQAVIDWTVLDTATGGGPIDFLPETSSALFQNGPNNFQGFVILNRIVPTDATRAIQFNGTVESIFNFGSASEPGGSVWFYSPGGIIAGPTARFDVGNLVLTASDIDTSGGLFGSNGEIRFQQALNPTAAVTIQNGAQINAITPGSYLALVAPRVVQAGSVDVNGGIAYVGAEAAELTINSGLFDISISSGTTGVAIDHSGTTTGPAAGNGIYLTTIAKNDAVSMLLSGSIGYTPAASATVDNGTIVLSAGYDVVNGEIGPRATANSGAGDILIGTTAPATFTSRTVARATDELVVQPAGTGSVVFTGSAFLQGDARAAALIGTGQSLQVGGDLSLVTGTDAPGIATIDIAGGTVTIGGAMAIVAENFAGLDGSVNDVGGNATGGTASVIVNGGSISVAGSSGISANSFGGYGAVSSGTGQGGTARLSIQNGGSATFADMTLAADGRVGDGGGDFPYPETGGTGTGGLAEILIGDGTLIANDLSAQALGIGGLATTQSGTGTGGTVLFSQTGGTATISGPVSLTALGFGGRSAEADSIQPAGIAGNGNGGTATLRLRSTVGPATLTAGQVLVDATGTGGAAGEGFNVATGAGGNGTGGTALFDADGAVTVSASDIAVRANGLGGLGGILILPDIFQPLANADAGAGGNGAGGSATVRLTSGNFSLFALESNAEGFGGDGGAPNALAGDLNPASTGRGGDGGTGTGGTALIDLGIDSPGFGSVLVTGTGSGGFGGSGANGGAGGTGVGGAATLQITDATMTLGAGIFANGQGRSGTLGYFRDGGDGGDGLGGTARLVAQGATTDFTGRDLNLNAGGVAGGGAAGQFSGTGTIGIGGHGGDGVGGTTEIVANLGAVTLTSTDASRLLFDADGVGGTGGDGGDPLSPGLGGTGGDAGSGTGGTMRFVADGGSITTALELRLSADGISGGAGLGIGGAADGAIAFGQGGFVTLSALGTGGEISLDATELSADGVPSAGATTGQAGNIAITTVGSGAVTLDSLDAHAVGDGAATGSGITVAAAGGALAVTQDSFMVATGSIGATGTLIVGGNASFDGNTGVTLAGIDAGGDVLLRADNGDVAVNGGLAAGGVVNAFGRTVALSGSGPIVVDQAQATAGALSISTGGTMTVLGSASGSTVTLTSTDIDIAADAFVGGSGTTEVTFRNGGNREIRLGGTSSSASFYRLTTDELQRVSATSLIAVFAEGETGVTIEDLGFSGTNLGGAGRFSVNSARRIDIIGAAVFSNFGSGNSVALDSGLISLVPGVGSISLLDGNGGLAGTLSMTGSSIVAASDAALTDIGSSSGLDAIDDRLGINDGDVSDDGYFRAGGIQIVVGGDLFIQNSGAASDDPNARRGFTVGGGGLTISTTDDTPARIVINGRQLGPDGNFITGAALIDRTGLQGADFNSRSTINGCLITGGGASCVTAPAFPPYSQPIDSVRDVIEEQVRPDLGPLGEGTLYPTTLIQLVDFQPFGFAPVVDEPVTGSGNDDFWMQPADDDERD